MSAQEVPEASESDTVPGIISRRRLLAATQDLRPYLGLGVTRTTYDEDGEFMGNSFGTEIDLTGLEVRTGTKINELLSAELRVGKTDEGDGSILGNNATAEVDWYFSGITRIDSPRKFGSLVPYGLLGFTDAEIETCIDGTCSSSSDLEFSYGLGVRLVEIKQLETTALSPGWLYFEWTHYGDASQSASGGNSDYEFSGFTLGYSILY